jgi:hypothetical protein
LRWQWSFSFWDISIHGFRPHPFSLFPPLLNLPLLYRFIQEEGREEEIHAMTELLNLSETGCHPPSFHPAEDYPVFLLISPLRASLRVFNPSVLFV